MNLDSPKSTTSLRQRGSPLVAPLAQLARLEAAAATLPEAARAPFDAMLAGAGWTTFTPADVEIFQINIGRLCNMTCRHCHVDAGPDRVRENMDREMVDACLRAIDLTNAHTVDITGGAPELNPYFTELVEACLDRGKHVIDRCNLTILLVPKYRHLPQWFAERGVEIVASLPHPRKRNTDAQRGDGTHERSMRAMKALNDAGYGKGDPQRVLTLMHNPAGAYLPGAQATLEASYRRGLEREGVTFDRLIALNNMPVARFLEWLDETGNLEGYLKQLVDAFNPAAVSGLMCRNTLSVSWDGTLYDCDFNQMLDLPITDADGQPVNIRNFDPAAIANRTIVTRRHCFGCTAGAGSSCGGATA
ncbi:MAG: arsenosugar biosynthesis radical SAM (seleno)protein ArsS [Myxococcota bacterium]